MRLVGAVFILTGCLGVVTCIRADMKTRLDTIRKAVEILENLAAEIRFSKATLPECFRVLAHVPENPFCGCFRQITERMQCRTGDSLGEVYRECMQECLKDFPLKPEEKNIILGLIRDADIADVQMQERELQRKKECLEKIARDLEAEFKEKSKVIVTLGTTVGIMLVILLL